MQARATCFPGTLSSTWRIANEPGLGAKLAFHGKRFVRCVLACTFLSGFFLLYSAGVEGGLRPNAVSDMIVVPHYTYGDLMYVADSETGALYSRPLGLTVPDRMELGEFKLAHSFIKPVAIAHSRGQLIVCDQGIPAVFKIRLDAEYPIAELMWKGEPLERPVDVAISDDGTVAVADEGAGSIILFHEGKKPETLVLDFLTVPTRLAFVGPAFYVLDRGSMDIYSFPLRGGARQDLNTRDLRLAGSLPHEVTSALGTIRDFVVDRGLQYIAGSNEVLVFASKENWVGSIVSPTVAPISVGRIAQRKRHPTRRLPTCSGQQLCA